MKVNGKLAAMSSDDNMENQVIPVQGNCHKDHSIDLVQGSREDEQAQAESPNLNLNFNQNIHEG